MGRPEAICSSLWGTWRAGSRLSLEPLCWPPGALGEGGLPVPPGHPRSSRGRLQGVGVAVPSGRDFPPPPTVWMKLVPTAGAFLGLRPS